MLANVVYLVLLVATSPWILYRVIRHGRYRRGLSQKFLGLSAGEAAAICDGKPCMWLHAVSVGEVNLLPRLIDRLRQTHPELHVVISTSTDSGYDLAAKHFGTGQLFFCPLDFTWAVRRTLSHLKPTQLVLTELELWPNLIRTANRRGVAVKVINARLSERSAKRYRQFAMLTRPIFSSLQWVGCQDEICRERFLRCGTPSDRTKVTGSLKFDDAPRSREIPEVDERRQWAGIDPWHQVWIVGSTQPGEEAMALWIYKRLRQQHEELRLILVPRHSQRFDEVATLVSIEGFRVHRRSQDESLASQSWESDRVILIDTIGELRYWWGVGQIATVGGSFSNRGGQNMLEPAGYGLAVSFGPDTRNFRQIANWLLEADAAVCVQDVTELEAFVKRCLEDIPAADTLGRNAQAVIERHRGATSRTITGLLDEGLEPTSDV